MKIVEVTAKNARQAGWVHSESWIESHKDDCTPEFVNLHSPENQMMWILSSMESGSRFYMLLDPDPKGIISVTGNHIAHLYIIPTAQNRGYGTELLKYAEAKCSGTPELWVRSTNEGAIRFYLRHGYAFSGLRHTMMDGLMLVEEMRKLEGEELIVEEDEKEEA